MVAMRFNTYKKDTLRGIQIYFNRSLNNTNEKYFKLVVWNEINNKPGNIIYIKENIKPVFEDSLNKFTNYVFDTSIVLEDNFYIGWQKVYANSLNVGFDVNRINNDKLFKNFAGSWEQSAIEGTVMIRPMFGKKINVPTDIDQPVKQDKIEFGLYPNPAKNNLYIDIQSDFYKEIIYTIVDLNGRVYESQLYNNSEIDISPLPSGIYFIRINKTNGQSGSKKFVIIR
jgi:hypothetical protein